MSSMANWTYVSPLTIWPSSFDEYGQPIFTEPYLIIGSWAQGGSASVDQNGTEFIPMSTYYFEALDGDSRIPIPEYYILRGDHLLVSDPTTINAEKIKKVGGWDMLPFGEGELPDWIILT